MPTVVAGHVGGGGSVCIRAVSKRAPSVWRPASRSLGTSAASWAGRPSSRTLPRRPFLAMLGGCSERHTRGGARWGTEGPRGTGGAGHSRLWVDCGDRRGGLLQESAACPCQCTVGASGGRPPCPRKPSFLSPGSLRCRDQASLPDPPSPTRQGAFAPPGVSGPGKACAKCRESIANRKQRSRAAPPPPAGVRPQLPERPVSRR